MIKRLLKFLLFPGALLLFSSIAYSQVGCLSISNTVQDVPCYGDTDGQISLTINQGDSPNAQPPFDIELYYQDSGGGLTQLAFHDDVTFTSIIFTPGNGSLNIAGADDFGIPSNDIDPGSEYRILVRSNGGLLSCRNKSLIGILVAQPTQLVLAGADVLLGCNGASTGSGMFTASGGTPPYTFNVVSDDTGATTSSTATTFSLNNAHIGSMKLSVTDSHLCTAEHTITVTEPPPLTLTGADVVLLCHGNSNGSGSFTAGGGTAPYTFTVNANTTTTGTTSSTATTLDFANASVGLITVTVQDVNSCSQQFTINITEPALLVLAKTSDVSLLCSSDTNGVGTFTASGGVAPYSFTVTSNTTGGTVSNTATTLDVANAGPGSITISVADANACTQTATISITAPPVLVLGTTADVALSCNGATTGAGTFTASGGTAPYTFTVVSNTTGGAFGVATATTISFSGAGVGLASVKVKDANNCETTSVINVTEPPPLTLTGADVVLLCHGNSNGSGSFTAGGGTAPYTFTVNANTTTTGTTSSTATTLDFANASVGLITVTVQDVNSCSQQFTINITEPALLVLAKTSDVSLLCSSDTNGVGTFTASGGVAPYSFTVTSNTTGGTVSNTATTLDVANAGPGSITISVADANACTQTATISITAPPVLVLGTTADVGLSCNGATTGAGTFTASGGTAPYTFTVVSNTTGGAFGVATATTISFSGAGVGLASVKVKDANNCETTSVINVTEPPPLTLTGADVVLLCHGNSNGSGSFTAGGGTAPYTFTVNANTTTTGTTSSTATTLDFANASVGLITVTVQDVNSCSQQFTINITEPALLVLAKTSDVSLLCSSDTNGVGTFTASGGVAPYSFTVTSNTTGGTVSNTATTLDVANAGPGSITISVADANACTQTATISITAPPVLVLGTTADVGLSCNGATTGAGTFTASGGTAPYTFTVVSNTTGGAFGVATATTISFSGAGVGLASVKVKDANNCETTSVINVTEPPPITAVLSGDNSICEGLSTSLTVTLTGTAPWSISYSDGVNPPTSITNILTSPHTFSVTPAASATYSLTAVSDAACTGAVSGSAVVTVNPILGDPTVFGSETWIGYVYDDNGITVPPFSNIDYAPARYRGFLDEAEIGALGFSSYDVTTDFFDLNTADNVPVAGPNICGSYLDHFSIRFRMKKTFAAGVYTFSVGGDDGMQLKVDGVLTALSPSGSFTNHGYNVYKSSGVCLTAGIHDVEIEYFEIGGFSRVSYSNQLTPGPVSTSPVTACVNSSIPTLTASSTDPGVTDFKWYNDAALTTPATPVVSPNYTPLATDLDMSAVGTRSFYVTSVYGACGESQATKVDVTVVSGATINPPTPPVQICNVGGVVDLTSIVSASPAGGAFTFSGTGITSGSNFDPTLVAGSSVITVGYSTAGCSAPGASFTINVVSAGTITTPAADVTLCQSAPVIQDLLSLVSATPAGGTFTFGGPGVTGTSFDPTGQTGTIPILVDYSVAGCAAPQKTFNFNIVSAALLTINNSASFCVSDPDVDLTTLVGASPAGGAFTFSGAGVTGNMFDPSVSPGATATISISYTLGGCPATGTVSILVGTPATLAIDNTLKVCATDPDIDLTTLVTPSVTGGVLTFTGTDVTANKFDPSNSAGSAVVINVTYSNGCIATGTVIVNVRSATDTVCGAVGPPPGGPCDTVVITPAPSPAICNNSDGSITFGITPAISAGLKIDVIGISTSNLGVSRTNFNNPILTSLPRGTYNYTIQYGDATCIKTGQVTIGKIGGVADPVATDIVEPLCFGDPSGSVKIDVAGETGNTLQWSLDGFATNNPTNTFIAGGRITGIPSGSAPTFQQTISVRKSSTDTCFGGVSITMKGPVSALDTLSTAKGISQPDLASGSLLVDIIESGEDPYEARLELIQPLFTGQTFAQDWTAVTRNTLNLKYEINFTGLFAGNYQLSLRDGLGCVKNYSVVIGVDTAISLPNIFTPNGDGINEVFYIRNLPANAQLIVSNRWGSEVYSSKNYQNDWNGGSAVDGVYYYKLSAGGQSFTGWIEILRGK